MTTTDTTETFLILLMLTTLSKIVNTNELNEIFAILKEDCGVEAAIYETLPEQPEGIIFDLKIQGVTFGYLVLKNAESNEFYSLVSDIIADKIKNREFRAIMQQQINTLQDGILKQDNEKRVKNNFFASVTHELRTPLNAIIGYSELMAQGIGGSVTEKQKEYLLDIQTSGLNLLNMINDILDFSKINSGISTLSISEFDVEGLFFEVSNTIAPLLKKKDLTLVKSIENFKIKGDYRKASQILINLLSNAIKFSLISDKIELYSLISDKKRIIEVKDYGIGIPKKSQKRIFKEFTQAANNKTKENSTGLGLAIVKKFCDQHGWKIELESEENKGSIFRIVIS